MSEAIDNRANRVETLKGIIQHLHAGRPAGEVRNQLVQIVKETDYSEVVAMEQQLMADGMPVEEVKSMCDLHSQVVRDMLVRPQVKEVPPGHPVDTFRRENAALGEVLDRLRALSPEAPDFKMRWRQAANELMDIEKHYQRKEHVFFPCLERHGIHGPSKVMWAKDDEIRAMLKRLASEPGPAAEAALRAVEEMIFKEENILLPMCQDAFTDEDWAEIWASSPRYGWCLVEPREGYRPQTAARTPGAGEIPLPTGQLSLEQLMAIFETLPVDLTFVDADDRVAFFSEGPDRIFARSRAVIGRKVQYCHPPKSVDTVDRILSDFREGRQNVAEFWIQMQGRFIHIRYFAVRESGRYLGTLEVTQDLTRLRQLEGERRLLEYDRQ